MIIRVKWVLLGIILIILITLVWAYFCCPLLVFRFREIDVEIQRLDSPDGKLDAVYIQRDAGAMTTAKYLIYVLADGQIPTKKDEAVFCGKRVYDLNYNWEKDCSLKIKYSKADIYIISEIIFSLTERW